MDSITMYNKLKEKHNVQEVRFEEDVTEKLTSVDIGSEHNFDVNRNVMIEGNTVSAKTAFMNVYSQKYVDGLSRSDASYITQKENMLKVINLELKTKDNAENLDAIHQYSENNTERDEKTRNTHRKKVNKYARKLILSSGSHRSANINYKNLVNKDVLTRNEKKTLKNEFMKKYKLDLEVIEQEYQMNKSLLKMGGKKDVSEEDSLFRLRYTRYAKAMAANNRGIEMANRYPELFDAMYFQKQLDKLTEKIKEIGETASPAFLESKKKYFLHSNERRTDRIQEKEDADNRKRKGAAIKAKIGDRIQSAINVYMASKAETALEDEVLWLQENITVDALAEALSVSDASTFLLADEHEVGNGAEFFKDFDKSMEMFIDRFLFYKATQISVDDRKELLRGGLRRGDIERSVLTQLHPVRRLKNGAYVSEEDAQNDVFNRKYIDSLIHNNMEARRECIEENFHMIYTFQYDMDNFEIDDFYETDRWKKFMLARINLGVSNLLDDTYSPGSRIINNKEVANEIQNRYVQGNVEVGSMRWDYSHFTSNLLSYYGFLADHKYNMDPGMMELSVDVFAISPTVKASILNELTIFVKKYRALKNNAIA